jgi:hypothetical protein
LRAPFVGGTFEVSPQRRDGRLEPPRISKILIALITKNKDNHGKGFELDQHHLKRYLAAVIAFKTHRNLDSNQDAL